MSDIRNITDALIELDRIADGQSATPLKPHVVKLITLLGDSVPDLGMAIVRARNAEGRPSFGGGHGLAVSASDRSSAAPRPMAKQ